MMKIQFERDIRGLTAAALVAASLWAGPAALAAPAGADLAAGEAAVRKADAEWAAAANTAGVDAWMTFYAADAAVLLPNERLVSGQREIREAVTHLLTLPRLSLAWRPIKVEMARSGDLALLVGAYELRFGDSRGMPLSDRGRVVELWKRQADGGWKCVADTWNSDESASPPAPSASAPGASPGATPAVSGTQPEPPPASESGKYGDVPVHYEEAIRQYFQEHLRDPQSVRYQEISKPERGYTMGVTGAVLMRETRDYGWSVKATVDARNSHGSYVGFKSYTFLFRGEKIVHILVPLSDDEMK